MFPMKIGKQENPYFSSTSLSVGQVDDNQANRNNTFMTSLITRAFSIKKYKAVDPTLQVNKVHHSPSNHSADYCAGSVPYTSHSQVSLDSLHVEREKSAHSVTGRSTKSTGESNMFQFGTVEYPNQTLYSNYQPNSPTNIPENHPDMHISSRRSQSYNAYIQTHCRKWGEECFDHVEVRDVFSPPQQTGCIIM